MAALGEIGGQPARQILAVLVCVGNEQAAFWGLGGVSRHRIRARGRCGARNTAALHPGVDATALSDHEVPEDEDHDRYDQEHDR